MVTGGQLLEFGLVAGGQLVELGLVLGLSGLELLRVELILLCLVRRKLGEPCLLLRSGLLPRELILGTLVVDLGCSAGGD